MNTRMIAGHSEKDSISFSYGELSVITKIGKNGIVVTKMETIKRRTNLDQIYIGFCAALLNCALHRFVGLFVFFGCMLGVLIVSRFIVGNKEFRKMHGAEHKIVNMLDQIGSLKTKDVLSFSRTCDRCGTSIIILLCFLLIIQTVFWELRLQFVIIIPFAYYTFWRFKEYLFFKQMLIPIYAVSHFIQRNFSTLEPDELHIELATTAMTCLIERIPQ